MKIPTGRLHLLHLATALASVLPLHAANAQTVALPAGYASGQAMGYGPLGGPYVPVDPSHPLPVGGLQESFALVTANSSSAGASLYGGDYILGQTCAAYGTLTLQVRGPDGVTFQTLLTRTAADMAGGTGVALGSGAVVRVLLSDTTGCNAILSRVP